MTINTTGDGNYAINGTISTGTTGIADGAPDGTVVISGGNYTGTNAFDGLIAGEVTDGVVTINNGAQVDVNEGPNGLVPILDDTGMPTGNYVGTFVAGRDEGSSGIINVDGTGTSLDIEVGSGLITIGHDGTGILNISNDAQVSITGDLASIDFGFAMGERDNPVTEASQLNISSGGTLDISSDRSPVFSAGDAANSLTSININGPGSSVNLNGDYGYARFGRDGQANVLVSGGAEFNVTGSNATLRVGNGRTYDGATVGDAPLSTLSIVDGGIVNVTSDGNDSGAFVGIGQRVTGSGAVIVSGYGSQLNISSNNTGVNPDYSAFLNVGREGQGALSVTNGGQVNISGGINDEFPGINIGRNAGASGSVLVDGSDSSINVSGSNDAIGGGSGFVTVGRAGSGELIVSNRGQFNNNSTDSAMFIGRETTAEGLVEVTGLGSLVDGGELVIVGADFDFSANDASAIDFVNGGQGRITVVDRGIFRGGEIYLGNGGAITGDGTIDGNVTLNGDDSTMTTAELGPGTGENPGSNLLITGDLTMTYGALNLELFGTTPANNDLISVSGIANLNGGSVDISFRDGFTAAAGDSFSLVFAADLNFDATNVGAGVFDGAAGQALLLADEGNQLVLTALNNDGTEVGVLDFDASASSGVNVNINDDLSDSSYGYGNGTGGGFDSFAFINVSEIRGTNRDDIINAGNSITGVTLNGRAGDDLLVSGAGADILNGGDGIDTVTYADSSSGISVFTSGRSGLQNGSDGAGDRLTDIENIIGSDHADQIVLNDAVAVDNRVDAGAGDDRIRDRDGGTNTLNGEGGEDRIFGSDGIDTIDGGADSDLLFGGNGNDILNGGIGDFRDEIFGNADNDVISGGGGDDRLRGETGEDTVNGGTGNDNIRGGVADDMLFGDEGDDTILGDQGDDIIDGGAGNDRLFGGNNSDTFIFATDYDFDRILDFQTNRDDIDLTDFAIADYATLEGIMVQSGGNVVIDFGDGDILQINAVTIAELDVDNFVL